MSASSCRLIVPLARDKFISTSETAATTRLGSKKPHATALTIFLVQQPWPGFAIVPENCMPLPHPWPGKDALWELQGVDLFHHQPGLRVTCDRGRCRGTQRASAQKGDALHNQGSSIMFWGSAARSATHAWCCLSVASHKPIKPTKSSSLCPDGPRTAAETHHPRCVARSLARLPDCAIAAWGAAPVADLCKHGRSNGGQAPAALNGGAVGNLGPTPRFHSPNFLHPQILATTMGDYDPAILFPDHPPDRATVSAQSQCRRADDTRATVSPAECIGHCGAWHTRTSESQLRR